MPRSREFAPEEVVKRATILFRRKGYFGTSIDDLVRETCVSRYGLYAAFKDKKGLFLAALDNFSDISVTKLLSRLEKNESSSLEDIYAYFDSVIASAGTLEGRLSCLMCSSVNELSGMDRDIDAKLSAHFQRLREAFRRALSNALQGEQFMRASSLDAECLADFLVGLAHGSASLNRSGASKKVIENFLRTALSLLERK